MAASLPTSGQTMRQVEIIHASLGGLALICLLLLIGMLLPMFGVTPIDSIFAAGIVIPLVSACVGFLYFINYRAHTIVLEQARLTDVLMNSLGQGFLTFDAKGICGPVYSHACQVLLDSHEIAGKQIADLLYVPPAERGDFEEWLNILFMPDHALSFDDAARFMPSELQQSNGRAISLSYRAVRDKHGRLLCIVLIATDKTEEKDAQKRADSERQFVAMVCAIFAEKQSFMLTMSEIKVMLDRLLTVDATLLSADFFRDVHTIKGAAMHFKMEVLGEKLHGLENTLREADAAMAEGRMGKDMVDALSQNRAEVHLEFSRIQQALRAIIGDDNDHVQGIIEVDEDSLYDFGKLLKRHNVSPDIYYAYQNSLLSVPLFTLLKSLDRQMLPLAEKLEKKVKPILFKGEGVRMPAKPLQHLLMVLTHVVHNIIDHGIEAPITRMAKGKDPQGQVTIDVHMTREDQRNWVEIIISDDGAGIDPARVRAKLLKAEPDGSWRNDNDEEIIQQLLTHEVSTRDEISMLSGRGAGMSAVYQEVLHLGGKAWLRSQMDKGTQLIIRLPEPQLPA